MKQSLLLDVQNLSVDIALANGILHPVRDVSFSLNRGESLGIVGESGSGKSLLVMALMRLLPKTATTLATSIHFAGENLQSMLDREFLRSVCGTKMSMIFQEPMTSLNPVYNIKRQLTETVLLRKQKSKKEALDRALFLLEKVGIANASGRLKQYPHQLSGGQRQRVMIAMALMNEPQLIIADEPTTALDVTVQAQILQMLVELVKELGMTMILITHDLGVISHTVDKVAVMYAGQLVETGTIQEVFNHPVHPYTMGLLECVPDLAGSETRQRLGAIPGIVPSMIGTLKGCSFVNRCPLRQAFCFTEDPQLTVTNKGRSFRCLIAAENKDSFKVNKDSVAEELVLKADQAEPVILSAQNVTRIFTIKKSIFEPKQYLKAVDDSSLDLRRTEVLALVGESGCGKTTLAKIILGLDQASSGEIFLEERKLDEIASRDRARIVQPVFQDPYSSLNPRRTIGETILLPLNVHDIGNQEGRRRLALETMERVGLPGRLFHRYPNQISGGQRQRVAIARALIMKPKILICDEPTSALDVSVQSQILNLLLDIRDEMGLTFLIITHDLGVVNYMATRIAVMYMGQIVEMGERDQIMSAPEHPYTKVLMRSVLSLQPGRGIPNINLRGGFPNPLDLPSGCRFHPRCPQVMARCKTEIPELLNIGDSLSRCWLTQNQP